MEDQIRLNKRINELVNQDDSNEIVWLMRYEHVESVIQNGPQCGIVALCMALKHLNVETTVDELMIEAKRLNFTISGEIFDNEFIFTLASKFYPNCKLVTIRKENDMSVERLELLLNFKLALVSYDCDFNFEPCFKGGIKAHWALVTGFLLPIEASKLTSISSSLESTVQSDEKQKVIDLKTTPIDYSKLAGIYQEHKNLKEGNENVYVICKQGKSKFYGLWEYKRLLDSNRQLKDIDQERCDPAIYMRPESGDLQETLAGKILVFY